MLLDAILWMMPLPVVALLALAALVVILRRNWNRDTCSATSPAELSALFSS